MKQVLCIDVGKSRAADFHSETLHEWNIHFVDSLADARRLLRTRVYGVGMVLHDGGADARELAGFLRQHGHLQWVGLFAPHALDSPGCHDLIVEHLCDYHTLPVDPVRLGYTLGHAHGWAMLRRHPRGRLDDTGLDATALVGDGAAMMRLRSQIDRVAKVAAPVLIWGESGSGKELAAQAIHAQSERAGGPFVPINCGAIAPGLIHSELFGYERGAFSGATRAKAGLIESAHGGTLFLDEIGDLPQELQVNLLRFLQEKTISRLGSTRAIAVDVRIVAASHVQLQGAVAAGAFREDLYYRLAVLPLEIPALRERRDDLPLLAEHFFRRYASEKSPRLHGFSHRALEAILDHAWPGNVRELINRVRRALVMADGRLITPDDLGLAAGSAGATTRGAAPLDDARGRSERAALLESLERSGRNVSLAARELGVSRTTMYRLMHKHSLGEHNLSGPAAGKSPG
jgi:DNA-binding NtrC family response regulator